MEELSGINPDLQSDEIRNMFSGHHSRACIQTRFVILIPPWREKDPSGFRLLSMGNDHPTGCHTSPAGLDFAALRMTGWEYLMRIEDTA
jgi:hypothetical protein